jgi:hypothetical protein
MTWSTPCAQKVRAPEAPLANRDARLNVNPA